MERYPLYKKGTPAVDMQDKMHRNVKGVTDRLRKKVPGLNSAVNIPSKVSDAYSGAGGGTRGAGAATGALVRGGVGVGLETGRGIYEHARDTGVAIANKAVVEPASNVLGTTGRFASGAWAGLMGKTPTPTAQAAPRQRVQPPVLSQPAQRVAPPTVAPPAAPVAPQVEQPQMQTRQPPAVMAPAPRPQRSPLAGNGTMRMGNLDVRFNDDVGMDDRRRFANAAPMDSTSTWEDMRRQRMDKSNSPGYIAPRQRQEKAPNSIGEMIMARGRMNLEKNRAGIASDRVKNRQSAIDSARDFQASSDRNAIAGRGIDEANRRFDEQMGFDREKFAADEGRENTLTEARLKELELATGTSDLNLSTARQIQALKSQAMDRNLSKEERAQAMEDLGILEGKKPTQYKSDSYEEMTPGGPVKKPFYYNPENPSDTGPLGPQPAGTPTTAAEKLASFKGTPQQKQAEAEYIKRYGKFPEGY